MRRRMEKVNYRDGQINWLFVSHTKELGFYPKDIGKLGRCQVCQYLPGCKTEQRKPGPGMPIRMCLQWSE